MRAKVTMTGAAKKIDSEAAAIAKLTRREREVINLVAEGLKNTEIAERLFISRATVRTHLTSVFVKLGVSGRVKLIIYAYRHGLVEIPR
jgi:DNA-binding NarL/FixJ family response regulator